MVTCFGTLPTSLASVARSIGALAALIAAFGAAGEAVAASDWAPRMEQVARCNWDSPGHNPFMGEVVAAIDRYSDIPTPVRMKLKQRMHKRQYDDLVDIRRDSITGRHQYEPTIRDMHFGLDRVCRQVTRANWSTKMQERGLVYCEAEHCILVPTVCRNVSRIERRPSSVAATQEGPATAQTPAATSSVAMADGAPPTAGSSFAEGVAGTTVALWPTGDNAMPTLDSTLPPTGAGPGGAPGGSWIAIAGGGGLPTYFNPGTSGRAIDTPGRGGNPSASPPPSGTPPAGGSTPTSGGSLLGGPGGSGDPPFAGPGGPGLGDPPIVLADPIGGKGPIFIPGAVGDGAGHLPVSPVPEPSTWLSLLIGLAVVAGATARRRRAAARL